MSVELVKRVGKKYTFQIEMELDDSSMLNSEEQIQVAVNQLGSTATQMAIEQFDTLGFPIKKDGIKMSSKGKQKKTIRRPTDQSQ